MDEQKVVAVPQIPGVRVEVTWKGGASQHIALTPEQIESGDLLTLSSPFEGRCIQLAGTDAMGVKKYAEVDNPTNKPVAPKLPEPAVTETTQPPPTPPTGSVLPEAGAPSTSPSSSAQDAEKLTDTTLAGS